MEEQYKQAPKVDKNHRNMQLLRAHLHSLASEIHVTTPSNFGDHELNRTSDGYSRSKEELSVPHNSNRSTVHKSLSEPIPTERNASQMSGYSALVAANKKMVMYDEVEEKLASVSLVDDDSAEGDQMNKGDRATKVHISAAPVNLGTESEQLTNFLNVMNSKGYERKRVWTADEVFMLADLSKFVKDVLAEICKAICDPQYSGDLSQYRMMVDAIVDRAYIDPSYCKAAAVVCEFISKTEEKQCCSAIPEYKFRRELVLKCQKVMAVAAEMRDYSVTRWLSFVVFLTELYRQHEGPKLAGIRSLIVEALQHLTCEPCCNNLVEMLVLRHVLRTIRRELEASAPSNDDSLPQIIHQMRQSFVLLPPGSGVATLMKRCINFCASDCDEAEDISIENLV